MGQSVADPGGGGGGRPGVGSRRPDSERRAALQAFTRALGREAHVLVGRPDLIWQQLHNRLQWAGEPLASAVAAERRQRSGQRGMSWARTRAPYRESVALVRTLAGHTGIVRDCAVSPDSTWVVSAALDGTLRIWDVASGEETRRLAGHTSPVLGCAVSPDGTWIVSASSDDSLRVWDTVSGVELRRLAGHGLGVSACAVSPDGTRIVSAGLAEGVKHGSRKTFEHTVKVWDAATGAELRTLAGHGKAEVNACAFSPDGNRIVSAGGDHTVKVWDAESGVEVRALAGHTGVVSDCAFSPDGRWVVSASWDGTLRVWDAAEGSLVRTLAGHRGPVEGCAVSADGSCIVSTSGDGTLRVWAAATGAQLRVLAGHTNSVYGCAVSPDGSWVVSAGGDATLKVWEVAGRAESAPPEKGMGHPDSVQGCAVSPDGSWIVSASGDTTLKIWDAQTGAELRTLTGHTSAVNGCAASPDGTLIASAGAHDKSVRVWDVASGSELRTLMGHKNLVEACAFTPDGGHVVSASFNKRLKVWDHASGQDLRSLAGHEGPVTACAVSPDGGWVVSASTDRTLRLWDLSSGRLLRTLVGHTGSVTGCAVTPDGRWVVSVASDRTLRVWAADSGSEIVTAVLPGPLACVAVMPRVSSVVCGARSGELHVLDVLGVGPWGAPSTDAGSTADATADGTVTFYTGGLLHKFGFGDGDILAELMEEQHLEVDRSDLLVAVVEHLVVPRLDQQVETYTLFSSHNPIRASTVDGVEADTDSVLTPEAVDVPVADILEVARTLGAEQAVPDLDRLDGLAMAAGPEGVLRETDAARGVREGDPARGILSKAVLLSAGALSRDRSQLPGQLLGRLRAVQEPGVKALVAAADAWRVRPWLRPLTASLTPPGQPLSCILRGQSDRITAVAVSGDGTLAASGSYYRDVRLWDLKRGTEVCRFEGERPSASYAEGAGGDAIVALAFSGGALVAVSADRCVYAIDVTSGSGRMVVAGETDNLFAVSLSADGKTLVAAPRDVWGYTDYKVQVWDTVDGRRLHLMEGPQGPTPVTASSGDGRLAASAGEGAALLLWDARLGRLLSREEGGARRCIALSEDGAGLALGADDGTVVVRHRAGDPTSARRLFGHAGPVDALAFAGPDRLVAGSADGTVTVWDFRSGQQVAELPAQGSGVCSVAGSRDGRWLVSGLADGSVRVWDLERGAGAAGALPRSHRGAVTAAVVGDDGNIAVTMGADGEVLRWDVCTGDAAPVRGGAETTLADLAGATPELVRLREGVLRRDEEEFGGGQGENHTLTGAAVSGDGHWALTSSTHWTTVFYRLGIAREDSCLRLWNLRRGKQERVLTEATRNLVHGGHVDAFRCVAIDRTGRLGAAGGDDHTVRVWDLADGELVASFTGESVITSCALSPDGRLLVAGEASGRVHLLRLEGRP